LPSHPAVVQALPSLSVHGVLSGFGGCSHVPVCGLHGGSAVHSFVSGGHVFTRWFWSQTPCPSQPAVVHLLLSVSVHGVLSGFAVLTHEPVSWSHAESTQSLLGQDGQSGMELDCWPDDERLLSQLASSADAR
jgi:hypothetical protein